MTILTTFSSLKEAAHTSFQFLFQKEKEEVSKADVELFKVLENGICHNLAGCSINESDMLHLSRLGL